jgi:hypothetical protein
VRGSLVVGKNLKITNGSVVITSNVIMTLSAKPLILSSVIGQVGFYGIACRYFQFSIFLIYLKLVTLLVLET